MKRNRILNSHRYLQTFLKEGDQFYIGILLEDYIKTPNLDKYKLPKVFIHNNSHIPKSSGPATRANIHGKYVRKFPEEKEIKTVHIRYTRKDGSLIDFYRDFHVYKKEMLHKFEIPIEFKENIHGQKIVSSTQLIFLNDEISRRKNTHVINLFCEMFGEFEVFNAEYEPAIHFNKIFEQELLPKGKLSEENIENLVEISKKYNKNEADHTAFQKRLHVLMEFGPELRGKGPNGFFGYLVFGFLDLGIIVLEAMYAGNATYIFSIENYEDNIFKDKREAMNSKQFLKRVLHFGKWETEITDYLKKLRK